MFVIVAMSLVTFFVFFETTRKAQSQGVLLPTAGIIRVVSGQSGVIREKRVREGQAVRAGDVLFILSSERSSTVANSTEKMVSDLLRGRLDSFGTELKQSETQSRLRLQASMRRSELLQTEIARNADQIALQATRVDLVEQAYKRYVDLQATGYISFAQTQDKQAEVLDQKQRLADLERIKAATERERAIVQAEMHDLQLQAQRETNALQRNVSVTHQDLTENEARREIIVRAPQDGVITAITAELGQTLASNAPLAALLPGGAALEAEIYAPSRSAGFIKPGMRVLLRYQAYPYQKFGQHEAIVTEVANTSLRPDELTMPGAAIKPGFAAEPLYRIRLKLDKQFVLAYGKQMPLKSGMLVDASVKLEQRRLYEWVLEPLFSISGRM